MSDSDKEALISGIATIPYKIEVLDDEGNVEQTFTENDIISTTYEDYRYVDEDSLCIGQFVARVLDGEISGIQPSFTIENKEIRVSMGVKVDDEITWYSLGNFLITNPTTDDVKDKTTFKAMDYTKKFNKTFDPSDLEYPTTALQLAQYCCEKCGVELATTDFVNNDFVIENNQYASVAGSSTDITDNVGNYTYRDVMKDIGKLAYSWVRIGWDNKCYIDFNIDSEVDEYNHITTNNYYDLSVQKEKFGPVNRVIIGLKDIEGENIVVEDEASIEENGVCEIRIYDNNLTYTPELRESVIESATRLFGLTYIPLEATTTGHPWLLGKEIVIFESLNDDIVYSTIPFDRTIEYSGHIKTKLNSKAITKTETEYRNYSNTESKLNTTRYIVDKHTQTIKTVVSNVSEQNDKISQISQTVDQIESQITDIPTITTENSGIGRLYLSNLMAMRLISLKIHPTDKDIIGLFASPLLKVKNGLKTLSRGITFDGDGYLYYTLPNNLYFYNNNIYDEFVYDGQEEKIYIIRKVEVDEQGNKSILDTPITEEYPYKEISVPEGDYNVFMDTYPTAFIYVKAMIKNDYTNIFATSYEVDSKITQKADEINLEVSKKVDETEVVSTINQSADQITITGNRFVVNSTNFKLTSDGTMTCKNANLTGSFSNYSSNNKLAINISGTQIKFYDYQGSENLAGVIASTRDTATGQQIGINLYTILGNRIDLGYVDSATSGSIHSILTYDTNNTDDTPWIINTASGTLFPDNSSGGITVRHGLIKNWSLSGFSGTIFEDAGGGIKIKNGLIESASFDAFTGDIYIDSYHFVIKNGLIVWANV